MSGHLFGPGHPAALLQAADLPLQQDVGLLQLPDLLDELAYVLQIIQTRTQRVGTVVLRLHKTRGKKTDAWRLSSGLRGGETQKPLKVKEMEK